MLELDGSYGEGGGQILRTALLLSMHTQIPFRIVNIRAKRKKPGLMRQHLTAVQAAAAICNARVVGAAVGSQILEFYPGEVQEGDYRFAIGTAGSCTLVLQTVLPALMFAKKKSTLHLQGGTHNPMCPPFHFLQRAFVPVINRMGGNITMNLLRHGFYPAGGGEINVTVDPINQLTPLYLVERGNPISHYAESLIAGIPTHVAKRELAVMGELLNWPDTALHTRELPSGQGPGNVLMATLEYVNITEVFIGFGEKGVAAEVVAKNTVQVVEEYRSSQAVVGEYLGDQLMLPFALAGAGHYTVSKLSQHAVTNVQIIEKFLPVEIKSTPLPTGCSLIEVLS